MSWVAKILGVPKRVFALLARGDARLQQIETLVRTNATRIDRVLARSDKAGTDARDGDLRKMREEVRELRRELRERLLQYHHELGRLARVAGAATEGPSRLSGRVVPIDAGDGDPRPWALVGGVEAPDPEGREWLELQACPVCGGVERTAVNPWNKLILISTAPDQTSARYDYALCHTCGVVYAARRPRGQRFRFLLEHFGEVIAKRGETAEITNRLLNPYPLTESDRDELRRLAAHGVFVSDHLGLRPKQYLAPLLRDRFENSVHVDILGALLEPRGARVLEVRSRAGTIVDGLRRAWGADVCAMPIWESQQFLLREVFRVPTSDLIDFENFRVPFDGAFDLIICNHMFTHVLHPRDFFAELRRALKPGGHIYLFGEPDDQEYLTAGQSMLAALNPLHMQAFDQFSLMRALAANGFETVFLKGRNLEHIVLARLTAPAPIRVPMTIPERDARIDAHRRAFDRAVLRVDESVRSRVAAEWPAVVARAVASGVAEYDERGQLHLVAR